MTLPVQGIRTVFTRSLFHANARLRTCTGSKYSSCLLKICIDPGSDLKTFSRSFSFESFVNYPNMIFNHVAQSDVCLFTKDCLVYMHDITGLPWWCTIAASAAIMKTLYFPFTVYQIKLIHRLEAVNEKMPSIQNRVYQEIMAKGRQYFYTAKKANRMYKIKVMHERRQLILKNNCHQFKIALLGILDIPLWTVMSMTLRTMAYGFSDDITSSKVLISQLMVEGPFWCSNLTGPDPLGILSALVFITYLAAIELPRIANKIMKKETGKFRKFLTNVSRCFAVFAAVVCIFMPSTVQIFWLFTVVMNFVSQLCMFSPKVRKALGLPYQSITFKQIFDACTKHSVTKVK